MTERPNGIAADLAQRVARIEAQLGIDPDRPGLDALAAERANVQRLEAALVVSQRRAENAIAERDALLTANMAAVAALEHLGLTRDDAERTAIGLLRNALGGT